MSEGATGMAATAPMAETRLRRKQLLSAEEAELFELAQAAGSGLDPEVFRNKTSSAVSGSQILAERSNREGSAQRMPRQPSASRTQKTGTSGKNSGGGN
ncbi:Mitotic-spindle organizing protein 2B, partial [Lamprotornis superbus]